MEALLGPTLVNPAGDALSTAAALAGAEYVGIYFSAHWCPPCKRFTPLLSKYVTDNGEKLKFKVVFATNDHSEAEFKSYFAEMSFGLALPFKDAHIEALSSKYGVEGIPTLVIVDKTGAVVNKEVRGEITTDPTGAEFPYRPKSTLDILAGATGYVDAAGAKLPADFFKAAGVDVLGIYFSAHVSALHAPAPFSFRCFFPRRILVHRCTSISFALFSFSFITSNCRNWL
jgi:thiol-disulfide isomerase/thioredoxin